MQGSKASPISSGSTSLLCCQQTSSSRSSARSSAMRRPMPGISRLRWRVAGSSCVGRCEPTRRNGRRRIPPGPHRVSARLRTGLWSRPYRNGDSVVDGRKTTFGVSFGLSAVDCETGVEMKAIHIHGRGGPDHLVYEDAPQPHPGPGEGLVRVYATGIIANELKWDETYQTTAGRPRALPISGRDLSGVVEEVGPGVTTLVKGSEVYAMLGYGRDGAEADYTISLLGDLVPKPGTLDHVQAAAVPLSPLPAWQALFDHARPPAAQSVLFQLRE